MKKGVNRREFLATSAAAATGLGLMAAPRAGAGEFKTTLKKALICGKPTEAHLAKLKADPNLMKYYSLARVFASPLWKASP